VEGGHTDGRVIVAARISRRRNRIVAGAAATVVARVAALDVEQAESMVTITHLVRRWIEVAGIARLLHGRQEIGLDQAGGRDVVNRIQQGGQGHTARLMRDEKVVNHGQFGQETGEFEDGMPVFGRQRVAWQEKEQMLTKAIGRRGMDSPGQGPDDRDREKRNNRTGSDKDLANRKHHISNQETPNTRTEWLFRSGHHMRLPTIQDIPFTIQNMWQLPHSMPCAVQKKANVPAQK
jgi:hypothetical protein